MKNIFKSKTFWINLILGIFGLINQDILLSFGVSPQWQVMIMAIINLVLRLATNTGITFSKDIGGSNVPPIKDQK